MRQLIDLVPMSHHRVYETASFFASHMHKLHKYINQMIESNLGYKLRVDCRGRLQEFNVGDQVMVCICLVSTKIYQEIACT